MGFLKNGFEFSDLGDIYYIYSLPYFIISDDVPRGPWTLSDQITAP
jgi:hypothetical protein